jgi:hypothetical protein
MNNIRLITIELDNKKIAFASNTEFYIQIGKGSKGGYKTKMKFLGDDFTRGFMTYQGINIGNGYKKRLISYNMNKPVLCKQTSY